jgi:hypothetical protein
VDAIEWVAAGELRLPPSRSGVDLLKLIDQYRKHGASLATMPPIEVTRCAGGLLVINNGVTRATRAFRYGPAGVLVPVVVTDVRLTRDVHRLPRVCDL